jgi:hypothetical protein
MRTDYDIAASPASQSTETSLVDFIDNPFLSDIDIVCGNKVYK